MAISKSYQINGVLDTNKTVLENLEILTSSCNSFFNFDVHTGKWSIIVNQPGSSIKSFNDSNIIGSILLSTTGMTDYYNQVQVDFPHKDLIDQTDTIIESIPTANWVPNEQLKILKLQFDTINDPVQAQLLGATQLKQSRIDQIIKFDTDYTSIGLQAGDLIDITNSIYGYTSKVFRVINVQESDDNNGTLKISITALEYNSIVYDTTTLVRQIRTPKNGIIQKNANTDIAKNDVSIGGVALALGAVTLLSAVEKLLTGSIEAGGIFDTIFSLFKEKTGIDLLGIFGGTGNLIKSTLITKDEGVILTSNTKSINFVGNGVTATTSGDDVTVTINASGTTDSGTSGNSNSVKPTPSTSGYSTGGEVCPLSYVKPGTYYVPYTPGPTPWKDSCTIGKHWTVAPDSTTVNLSVDLTLSDPVKYGSGPFYVRYNFRQTYSFSGQLGQPGPKVGTYYNILNAGNLNGYLKCSNIIGDHITFEYPYNPGGASSNSGRCMGDNSLTTTEVSKATYNYGTSVGLKNFTLSNPSDLNYTGTYTLNMSCTVGQITVSIYNLLQSGFNQEQLSAYRSSAAIVTITPTRPLNVTGTGSEINQIIGSGDWTYFKNDQGDEFTLPPPHQSVDIIYKITYNGDTKTFTDTMTYVPYEQWKNENNDG